MPLPLYVDLDGTLVATDTLWESLLIFLKQHPAEIWHLPIWLWRGKAGFKEALAQAVHLDAESLPYREEVLALIRARRDAGGAAVLATAAHVRIAEIIANHLGCFDAILATEQDKNLAGSSKAEAIVTHARTSFAYLGDHEVDLPIWQYAQERLLLVCSPHQRRVLTQALGQDFDVYVNSHRANRWMVLSRALRLHQWAKNGLLFVPLILAHRFYDISIWKQALPAFIAFGLTASSIYLLNDLLDLATDRRHPHKRLRPLAAGTLSIPAGLALSTLCLGIALLGGWILVSGAFALMLIGYVATTLIYSFSLKRLPIIDVLALAFFYVYRLVAGAVATGIALTPWLLAFAAFLFISLGCLKRVGELTLWRTAKTKDLARSGRGYEADDVLMLALFGVNAGFLSMLVLALYINSSEVMALYTYPAVLWGVVVALLYWLMRMWLLTWRGSMHDDPVLFALEDKMSRIIGGLVVLCLILAI